MSPIWLLEAGWLLVAILSPLWVNFWLRHPFELPKVMLVRTLAGLLIATALLMLVRKDALYAPFFSIRRAPFLWPVITLAGVLILSTVTAVQPALSLWGSYERGQGLMTQLAYLSLFLLLATHLRTLPQIQRLLTALVLPGALLVLLGLAQALGWQPLPLLTDARSPVYATLGRSNFLAAYLAILLPLTLALLLTCRQKWQRLLLAALLLSEAAVLGIAFARSAWLAALVGLALFAWLWRGTSRQGTIQNGQAVRWRRVVWVGLVLLALSGPLVVAWLAQAEQGSTAARLTIWRSTVQLIGERPFLGYGLDSLPLVFPRVFPPELVYYQGRHFFVDRAHNWLLDWALSTGLLGLLAFVSVLAAFMAAAGRALRQADTPEKRTLLAGAVAAVGANLTNNLVSFDVTATATTTWLLMGMVVAATPEMGAAPAPSQPLWRRLVFVLLALAIATAVLVTNGRLLLADAAAHRADQNARAGRLELAANASERAIAYWPLEPSYYHDLSHYRWQQAQHHPDTSLARLQQAETALLTARTLRPQDIANWAELAGFYGAAARDFGMDTRPLAHHAYRQAAALAPNHAVLYVAWGQLYLEENDLEQAAPLLRQAVRLDASHGLAYILLAETELGLGRMEAAIADYHEAVRLEPQSSAAHAGLARSYWLAGQPAAARSFLTRALELDPNNATALALAQEIDSYGGER